MAKYSAYGTALKLDGTAFANVRNISGPGLSLDTEDVTTHDSTDGWEEVVGTILRSGEVTFDIVYDPANATHKNAAGGLIYKLAARAYDEYTLEFPDLATTTWTFNAFVTGFEPGMPHDGALTASVKMKLTGKPTLV